MNVRLPIPLPPETMPGEAPLAPEQQGLWYLQQVSPACGAYHLLFSVDVELRGDTLPTLAASKMSDLVARHDILRTALPDTPEGPVQRVRASITPDLRVSDATTWSEQQLRDVARNDSRIPFDLACAPLWRVHLYRRGADRWLMVVVTHHVLLDFWSLGLLLQELAGDLGMVPAASARPDGSAYGAHATRRQASLKDPLRTDAWLTYWRTKLDTVPPVHALPLDASRTTAQVHDGLGLPFALDAATSDAVRRVAREHAVTPFMVLLSVYGVLLQRFSNEDDLVVATPVAGRNERAQQFQLGHFVNTVALRLQPDARASFGQFLQQTRAVVVGALRHADCPFAWLVEELAPRRDASHAPLVQIGFSWERLPLLAGLEAYFLGDTQAEPLTAPGALLRPFDLPQQEGQFELMLEMGGERQGTFVGVFKYQHHLFTRETVATLAECFTRLAQGLTAAPLVPLHTIGMERTEPHDDGPSFAMGPTRQWPAGSILESIGETARRTPGALAVRDRHQALDYAALWQQAQDIAAGLRQHGVRPGDRVGLMLQRQAGLVSSILGIWLAGAAYVALDPDFPLDRLGAMSEDAQLAALVSESSLTAMWPDRVPALCIDEPLAPGSEQALPSVETAYILYTSGSTGRPKGVRVGHASVRNFLLGMRELLQWNSLTRLLAVTTPAFDISVLELLLPLLDGGEVWVADAAAVRDGQALASWLGTGSDHRATAMQATPATWRMLLDSGWAGQPGLTALCGGEALPPLLAEQLLAHAGEVWNLYGPTETTVWSTALKLQAGAPVHLGFPIANTQLHVLDPEGRALPPGAPGELWIGGDGLALDYWRQPDITAERFRHLPTLPGAGRVYRTGDRVRWRADGRLDLLGRLDAQVKLRGFRIELGEIENTLRRQPGVADAAVMIREDRPGDPRLVAYLVSGSGDAPSEPMLRQALAAVLPSYMQPSAMVVLDALPQTPNRKLDRRALPAPPEPGASADSVAPRDALEIQLAGLFATLLGLDRVGIHDGFFDLGGHSLLAVRLVANIRRLFEVDLAVAELLQHASVATLAERLRRGGVRDPGTVLTLRAGRDNQPLWLFHPIGGTVFCYLELTRRLSAERPVLALQSPGLGQAGEAEVTVEAMAQRYLVQLRERQPHGPYLLGGWCFGGAIAFEAARQLTAAGEEIDGLVLIDTRAPVPANVPSDGDDATLLSWFARDLASPYGKQLIITPETLRSLAPDTMFSHVLAAAQTLGVLPADADTQQLGRYFEVYLANGFALQSYFPPPCDLPVRLLRALDEPADYGPTLGWDTLAPRTLQVIDLPGEHNTIVQAPFAAAVAAYIDQHHPLRALLGFST